MKYNDELNNKLKNYSNKKIDSIKTVYMGSSALLATTPFYIYTINEDNLLVIAITLLEVGLITISVKGISNIIKTSRNIKLVKKNINNHEYLEKDIIKSYSIVKEDLNRKILTEKKSKKKKQLIKLRNNINLYSK